MQMPPLVEIAILWKTWSCVGYGTKLLTCRSGDCSINLLIPGFFSNFEILSVEIGFNIPIHIKINIDFQGMMLENYLMSFRPRKVNVRNSGL